MAVVEKKLLELLPEYGMATPIIASVEPRQVQADELLTIYGQTCFGDAFKYEEGQSLKSEFSMSGKKKVYWFER